MKADKKICLQCAKAEATKSMQVSQPRETLHFCAPCYRLNVEDRDYTACSEAREASAKYRYEK